MRTSIVIASLIAAGCAGATASSSGEPVFYAASEVEQQPVFAGCSRFDPGTRGNSVVIPVSFAVRPDGKLQDVRVRSSSVSVRKTGHTAEDIRDIVASCEFRPATLNGQPVGVRQVTRRFSFPIPG